jgi:SAM-dependent methyltransferase
MHKSSLDEMSFFLGKYLNKDTSLDILDVGSMDVNKLGTYRSLMSPKWTYTGLDISGGRNVDIVIKPYNWDLGKEYDVVICGQCLEHVEDMSAVIDQILKHLKPNGFLCIIVPWRWDEHKFPLDCWRVLPDGMRWLLRKTEILSVHKNDSGDCVGVAKKYA